MKQVIDGNGADSTATVQAYLQANHQFLFADLYLIGEIEDPASIWLTNWESALVWSPWGTFNPTAIKRGSVGMKIGLEVATLELNWSPKLTAFGQTIETANFYQKAWLGFYRNWRVRVWRCIMPTPGDANTYGAYQLFGGRIAQANVHRGLIKFTVNSFLDCINEKVPPNVIETTNILAGYTGATPVLVDGETTLPQFSVVPPSTTTVIVAQCTAPTANKIYGDNKLQFGYLVFLPGSTLAGAFSSIATSNFYNAGGGIHFNRLYVYSPFPWAPSAGDKFYVSTAFPLDQAAAQAAGFYRGFPYVPAPETAT